MYNLIKPSTLSDGWPAPRIGGAGRRKPFGLRGQTRANYCRVLTSTSK